MAKINSVNTAATLSFESKEASTPSVNANNYGEERQRPSAFGALASLAKKITTTATTAFKGSSSCHGGVRARVTSVQDLDDNKLKLITLQSLDTTQKKKLVFGKFVRVQDDDATFDPETFPVVSTNAAARSISIAVRKEENPKSMATFLYTQGALGSRVTLHCSAK